LRPTLTVSLGLRYENQTNISSDLNFAPRVSFAWSPGGGGNRQSKTVVRGGFGVFYDRFPENLVLRTNRFNGENQLQFTILNPTFFPNVPTIQEIQNMPGVAQASQITRRISPNLSVPYTMQGILSIERQLPHNFTVSTVFITSRTLHQLRSRDINAPLPGPLFRRFREVLFGRSAMWGYLRIRFERALQSESAYRQCQQSA